MTQQRHQRILKNLGLSKSHLLGKGMEGSVYDYDQQRVVKLWNTEPTNKNQLNERKEFYKLISEQINLPVPEIFDIEELDGVIYTIEKKLNGKPGHQVYLSSNQLNRNTLLNNYFDILLELRSSSLKGSYGQLITGRNQKIQAQSWTEFLSRRLDETINEIKKHPNHSISNINDLFERFKNEDLVKIDPMPTKKLVHGDIFLENVLVDDDFEISGLLDFSSLSVVGDHRMDVAGLVYFITVSDGIGRDAQDFLLKKSLEICAVTENELKRYLIYFSLLFINCETDDPRTYFWCKNNLIMVGYI